VWCAAWSVFAIAQTAVAAKTNTNDVSLLRLVNKFVRQVHGGRVTSCKVLFNPRASHPLSRMWPCLMNALPAVCVHDGALVVFACVQSAKDRSSMEITYEQSLILEEQHHMRFVPDFAAPPPPAPTPHTHPRTTMYPSLIAPSPGSRRRFACPRR
jgi:hypothetical protein